MMQAFQQFSNVATSRHLPTGKIFEMLSLPDTVDREEFIQKPHTIPYSGEEKTVIEMTTKELREVTKKMKEAEQRASTAEKSAKHWENVAKSTPVRVETKTVEVIPADYTDLKKQSVMAQQLNTEVVQLKRANEQMRQQYEEKLTNQHKRDAAKRDLQKYLSEHLRALTMNHDSAIFNFTEIQGDRDAHEMVSRFLHQKETIIKAQFAEWEQLTTLRAVK